MRQACEVKVADPAFLLDRVRHPPRRPQSGLVAQCRPTLQPALDLLQVLCAQAGSASGAPGFPQTVRSFRFQWLRPPTHRLPLHADPPRHLGLMNFPWPATAPPASAGAPVPESLAVPPPDFPWADDSSQLEVSLYYSILNSAGMEVLLGALSDPPASASPGSR